MNYSKTKICIIPHKLGLGGPASFQSGLVGAMQRRGVTVTHNPLEPSLTALLVFGAAHDFSAVVSAQRAGVRVVQRLNGMNWVHRRKFTGVKHFIKAEFGNLRLRQLRLQADRIIYQSHFARAWWERQYQVLEKPQFIIHNGVDLTLFSSSPQQIPSDRRRVLMVEGHYGGGYEGGLESAARLIQQLNLPAKHVYELAVAGDVPQHLRRKIESTGIPVKWFGVVNHEAVPELNRSAHLLYSADINAACPNSVIEAMACGLPVIAYDTGALPELVSEDAGRIAAYGADVWKLEPPDVNNLSQAATQVFENRVLLSSGARRKAEMNFDIEQITEQYLAVLLGE